MRTLRDVNEANRDAWDSGEFRHGDALTSQGGAGGAPVRLHHQREEDAGFRDDLTDSVAEDSTPEERKQRKNENMSKISQNVKPENRNKMARQIKSQRAASGEAGPDYIRQYYGKR